MDKIIVTIFGTLLIALIAWFFFSGKTAQSDQKKDRHH